MALSIGARALKFALFVFNLVFLLCGVVACAIGVWLLMDRYAIDSLAEATSQLQGHEKTAQLHALATKPAAVRHIGWLLLGGGLLVISVAFLGCCGAAKEWRPLLCCYATCLMAILATEIAAAIYAGLHSHMFENDFREILQNSLRLYNGTDVRDRHGDALFKDSLMKTAWDGIMIDKACCGVDSQLGEFKETGWYKMSKQRRYQFPPACCPPWRNGTLLPHCAAIQRYTDGCYSKLVESLQHLSGHFKMAAWIIVLIALVQAFGITVAFCLCNAISQNELF